MENKDKIWQENLSTLKQNVVLIDSIFNRASLSNGVWKWLGFMTEEIEECVLAEISTFDLDRNFKLSVAGLVDFSLLKTINTNLESLHNTVKNNISTSKNIVALDLSQIDDSLERLDIIGETKELFLDKISATDQSVIQTIEGGLNELVVNYEEFKNNFLFVAVVLLYYTPEKQFSDFESFDKIIQELYKQPIINKAEWYKVFRYLGQGFYSRDGSVRNWAVLFLTTSNLTEDRWKNFIDKLLFIILLYSSCACLKDLSEEDQVILIERHLWWILVIGIPFEFLLEESLAEEPLLLNYVSFCGHISETLSKSKQSMNFTKDSNITVGKFLNDFVGRSSGKELDGYQQVSYIEDFIKNNKYFGSYQNYLIRLLHIYLHMREMDFIDYKGMLSDEGAIAPKYNWSSILHNEISSQLIQELRRYFIMLRRPARLKVELIINFMKLDWKEDLYLNRILVLSELYEETFSSFGPLVYFDENTHEWEFNKEVPPLWMKLPDGVEIISSEDLSEEELIDFNKSDESIL